MKVTLTPQQQLHLVRLEWAAKRSRGFRESLQKRPQGWEVCASWVLITKAVHSLYVDCCEAGAEELANELLASVEP